MRRRERSFVVGDERLTVRQIMARTGLSDFGVRDRIRRGLRGLDLMKPAYEKKMPVADEFLSRREIAQRTGLSPSAVTRRLQAGISGAELLRPRTPVEQHEVDGEVLTVQQMADRAGLTVAGMRYRLRGGSPGRSRKVPTPGVRLARPVRGAPASGEYLWEREIAEAAQAIAATWRAARGGNAFPGRLRWALTKHSSALLRLFRRGARVSRLGVALCGMGLVLDDGRPLNPKALLSTWVRIEGALIQRMAAQKDQAA